MHSLMSYYAEGYKHEAMFNIIMQFCLINSAEQTGNYSLCMFLDQLSKGKT